MINRIEFFDSISGIKYPEMLVDFFDQFIALKQLVEDYGVVTVENNDDHSITFLINFSSKKYRDKALSNITSSTIIIYNRPISINVQELSDTELRFNLQ